MINQTKEKTELIAIMNMFVAIKKLCKHYTFDQAIDVLDMYFKTDDPVYLTNSDDIRNFIVNNNIRSTIYPLIEGKYKHLYEYIESLDLSKDNTKAR